MSEVLFYHLEHQTLDDVLPLLLEKTLARGWRAVVEVSDESVRDHLDRHLWTYRDESFLPHAKEGDGPGERQPVWLTIGPDNPNGAAVRFLADRAAPHDIEAYERVILLFSAEDQAAVTEARSHWKTLNAAGHDCTYWRQTGAGRWEKKA
ncbi:MAG: DNA polymerase III subunit chi [Pseudomonadota bacterium]